MDGQQAEQRNQQGEHTSSGDELESSVSSEEVEHEFMSKLRIGLSGLLQQDPSRAVALAAEEEVNAWWTGMLKDYCDRLLKPVADASSERQRGGDERHHALTAEHQQSGPQANKAAAAAPVAHVDSSLSGEMVSPTSGSDEQWEAMFLNSAVAAHCQLIAGLERQLPCDAQQYALQYEGGQSADTLATGCRHDDNASSGQGAASTRLATPYKQVHGQMSTPYKQVHEQMSTPYKQVHEQMSAPRAEIPSKDEAANIQKSPVSRQTTKTSVAGTEQSQRKRKATKVHGAIRSSPRRGARCNVVIPGCAPQPDTEHQAAEASPSKRMRNLPVELPRLHLSLQLPGGVHSSQVVVAAPEKQLQEWEAMFLNSAVAAHCQLIAGLERQLPCDAQQYALQCEEVSGSVEGGQSADTLATGCRHDDNASSGQGAASTRLATPYKQVQVSHATSSPQQPAAVTRHNLFSTLKALKLLVFLDLDNWASFFKKLPAPLPPSVFVWGFHGGSGWTSSVRLRDANLQTACHRGMFYLNPRSSGSKNSADVAMAVEVGHANSTLSRHIPFAIVSGDRAMQEIVKSVQWTERRVVLIDPHNTRPETMLHTLSNLATAGFDNAN